MEAIAGPQHFALQSKPYVVGKKGGREGGWELRIGGMTSGSLFPLLFPTLPLPLPHGSTVIGRLGTLSLAEEVLEVDAAWGRGMDDVSRRLGRR